MENVDPCQKIAELKFDVKYYKYINSCVFMEVAPL